MYFIKVIFSNYVLNVGFMAWFAAQLIKTILAFIPNKKVVWERMVGSGGMPSSHSSLICAIAVGIAKTLGYDSPEFGLALGMAGIVMYDAMGVRRAAGEQAKMLNQMSVDFKETIAMFKRELQSLTQGHTEKSPDDLIAQERKRLKEFLGHTPLEVLCGAILGILIAVLVPVPIR